MTRVRNFLRGAALVGALAGALSLGACANNPGENAMANASTMATPGSQQDFTINVGDRVFFATDSSALSAQAQATLAKQAQWLNHYSQYNVTIQGNTDSRGTREYNLALGARRAQVVRDYLVGQGIAPNRIQTISYGEERPVATCQNESCWSQNRRAVTVLNGGPATS